MTKIHKIKILETHKHPKDILYEKVLSELNKVLSELNLDTDKYQIIITKIETVPCNINTSNAVIVDYRIYENKEMIEVINECEERLKIGL